MRTRRNRFRVIIAVFRVSLRPFQYQISDEFQTCVCVCNALENVLQNKYRENNTTLRNE